MRLDPQVTNVYAEALFSTARKRGVAVELIQRAQNLIEGIDREPRLRQFFEAPHISVEAKLDLSEKLLRPRAHPLLADFVSYLIKKGRIEYLRDILVRFQTLVRMDQGIFAATVTTATGLTSTEQLHLKSALEAFTKKQLEIAYKVDALILGGVIFSAQDTYIDSSLRGHLKRLHDRLQTVAVH